LLRAQRAIPACKPECARAVVDDLERAPAEQTVADLVAAGRQAVA